MLGQLIGSSLGSTAVSLVSIAHRLKGLPLLKSVDKRFQVLWRDSNNPSELDIMHALLCTPQLSRFVITS